MSEPPSTRTLTLSETHRDFEQIVHDIAGGGPPVVVEERGTPVAAIISAAELGRLTRLADERRRDFAVIHDISAAFKDVPLDELEREVDRAVREVRAAQRRPAPAVPPGS